MESRQWLPVIGYEGLYEVNDHGELRSLDRTNSGHRGRVLRATPSGQAGVLTVKLSRVGVTKTWKVSTLVAQAFLGPRPPGLVVRHWNDQQSDNRASNLLYGTGAENMQDMLRNGNNSRANRKRCPRSHELCQPNLVASRAKLGHRICLACARACTWVRNHPEEEFVDVAQRYYEKIMDV